MRTWIMIDATYLCHRAYHSTGNLSYDGDPTGVIYGFLRDITKLRRRFATERMVFCWDHGQGIREQRYPFYKETRRKMAGDPDYEKKQEIMRPQVEKLKTEYVEKIGYRNNFYQTGYEADDLIASIIKNNIGDHDDFIIVTGDTDMYQLIRKDQVVVFHPREEVIVNEKVFVDKYGVTPDRWSTVKAIAGCGTDDVPGLDGVGIKTACKYLRGEASKGQQEKIKKYLQSKKAAQSYLLVNLPFKGVKDFDLWDDERDEREYKRLLNVCGIKSLE